MRSSWYTPLGARRRAVGNGAAPFRDVHQGGNMNYRILCLLAVGCLAFLTAGCSKKSVQSDGRTSSAARPPIQEPLPNLSLDDPSGTERLNSGIAVAKNDPATARRLMDEGRAEQAATAAAGLRDIFFGYDSWTIS